MSYFQELGTQNFFERGGKPYCEDDYHSLFSPRCAGCNGAILDKCISALVRYSDLSGLNQFKPVYETF
jgi:hypothetical protein